MLSAEHYAASKLLLDSALGETSKSSLVTDAQRRTIYCNQEFTRVTGYGIDEMLGVNCDILQGPDTDPDTVEEIRRTLDEGLIYQGRLLNYRRDGSRFWNDVTICPIRDSDGVIVNFVSVQRDVTEDVERELARLLPE